MEKYLPILICLPIVWFFGSLSIELLKLIKSWFQFKIENLKEFKIWD
jgi:hypothetical protein